MTERDDRTRDAFLAMVGHELRQPLAPILTALEIMRQRRSRETGERARRTIERQVWQLARFVDDLMDYSSAQRGLLAVRVEPVDLRTILDTAIETAQPMLLHREQRVEVSMPEEPVVLVADPARLTQIFANLLSNLARLVEPGSTVGVAVTRQDDDVSIVLRDGSQGISSETLREIFRLMVNVDHERGWPREGIGLAVVRTLVDLHGGSVEAIEPRGGEGAQFVVRLPQTAGAGVIPPAVRPARSEPDPPSS